MSHEDETPVERRVRLGFLSSAVVGTVAVLLFIGAILFESGKAAGVGGVLVGVAVVVAVVTATYNDYVN